MNWSIRYAASKQVTDDIEAIWGQLSSRDKLKTFGAVRYALVSREAQHDHVVAIIGRQGKGIHSDSFIQNLANSHMCSKCDDYDAIGVYTGRAQAADEEKQKKRQQKNKAK